MEKWAAGNPPIKILLVDVRPSIRIGLRMQIALQSDLLVIGEAGDDLSAAQLILELEPDVIVLDLDMPEMDGFATLSTIHNLEIHVPVIILSIQSDPASRERAYILGAAEYIEKTADVAELVNAIRRTVRAT